MKRLLVAILLLLPLAAMAEEIVLGLSQDEIAITANFNGSEIIVFGAVSRETAVPEGNLGVIIAVAGPDETVTVRRKDRRFGIWVNTEAAEIDAAPTFYAVATNHPLDSILSATEDLRHEVSIPNAIRAVDTQVSEPFAFTGALARIRLDTGLYQLLEGAVTLRADTLFDTRIRLPANLTEGEYETRIFLTRDRDVIAQTATTITVRKVGLERLIYTLAHEQPLIYGIVSLAIAIIAGWGASAIFQLIRR